MDQSSEFENTSTDYVKCTIEGVMILRDSISLEPVEYPFKIDFDDFLEENCKNNQNSLDIFTFLWENIVLELPLQFTKVDDYSKYSGDGWKLVSEEELQNKNNPFKELLNDFDKE